MLQAVEMLQIEMKQEDVEDMVKAIDKDGSGTIDFHGKRQEWLRNY